MPKASSGVQMVWNLAALEAVALARPWIDREELFLALLKVEAHLSALGDNNPIQGAADRKALKNEVTALGDCLRSQRVNIEKAERHLRHLVGKGSAVRAPDEEVHRSDACREAFNRAILIAGNAAEFHCLHLLAGLLEQPGVIVAQAVNFSGGDFEKLREAAGERGLEFASAAAAEAASTGSILTRFGCDLTQMARDGKIEPIAGRRKELVQLVRILSRKSKNNPILVGEPGVGKTALVRSLALRIAEARVPAHLAQKRIIEISLGSMIAGTRYRGEFEERVMGLIEEARNQPDTLLFIDEIHTLVGAGAASGAMDAANILKPVLSNGDLHCIGATTMKEYRKYFEADAALSRRFQPLPVDEPSPEETVSMLMEARERYENYHGVRIAPSAIKAAVDLSCRHLHQRRLPDKAFDLLDEACVRVKVGTLSFRGTPESPLPVTAQAVEDVISDLTGIPQTRLSPSGRQKLKNMAETLAEHVIGQPDAIERVARMVTMARAGLRDPGRPVGVFLFLGPSGVGKTELSRALAEYLFGSAEAMIRLDMSEYKEPHSVSRLIGSPPGYVGHDEEGQLTGRLKRKPYSLVLLDEIEKAHPEVHDLFLQLFDEGRLTDAHGETADGRHAIFIMTSNIAASARSLGFLSPVREKPGAIEASEGERRLLGEELGRHFRREFLNRIDEIVPFRRLEQEDLQAIARLMLQKVTKSLKEHGIAIEFTDGAVNEIVRLGFNQEDGARPLARTIDRLVNAPLSRKIVNEEIKPGDALRATMQDNRIVFEPVAAAPIENGTV